VENYSYSPVYGDLTWTIENGSASTTDASTFDVTWNDPFDGGSITLLEADSTGCTNTMTWTILNVGIDGVEGPAARIFPNPASGTLNVYQIERYFSAAELRDMTGRLVQSVVLQGGNNAIEVSALPAGSYLITVWPIEGEAPTTQKVLIH
jgi:hypothetical protein